MDKLKIVYINLNKRVDRKKNLLMQFEKINVSNFERFEAIETAFGGLGCCSSHIKILEDFYKENVFEINGVKYGDVNAVLMVLEDDAEFIVSREELNKYINEFISSKAYGMCLGYNPHIVRDYNDVFWRSIKVATTSCYVVKLEIIPVLIECFRKAELGLKEVNKIMESNNGEFTEEVGEKYHKCAIDQVWGNIHSEYLWLLPIKKCVEQYANYSDIFKKNINKRY